MQAFHCMCSVGGFPFPAQTSLFPSLCEGYLEKKVSLQGGLGWWHPWKAGWESPPSLDQLLREGVMPYWACVECLYKTDGTVANEDWGGGCSYKPYLCTVIDGPGNPDPPA